MSESRNSSRSKWYSGLLQLHLGTAMNDDQRITKIQQARTSEELDRATDGYQKQVVLAHPTLQTNNAFNASMQRGQYFHALGDVKRASRAGADKYQDVIRVLEKASEKQLSMKMF